MMTSPQRMINFHDLNLDVVFRKKKLILQVLRLFIFKTNTENYRTLIEISLNEIGIGITTRINNLQLQLQHNTRTGIEITNIQTKHQRIILPLQLIKHNH